MVPNLMNLSRNCKCVLEDEEEEEEEGNRRKKCSVAHILDSLKIDRSCGHYKDSVRKCYSVVFSNGSLQCSSMLQHSSRRKNLLPQPWKSISSSSQPLEPERRCPCLRDFVQFAAVCCLTHKWGATGCSWRSHGSWPVPLSSTIPSNFLLIPVADVGELVTS